MAISITLTPEMIDVNGHGGATVDLRELAPGNFSVIEDGEIVRIMLSYSRVQSGRAELILSRDAYNALINAHRLLNIPR